MATEQRQEYVRERRAVKREQMRREKMKKQKLRMKLLFVLELLCIFAMLTYLLGRKEVHKSIVKPDVMRTIPKQEIMVKELYREQQTAVEETQLPETDILLVNKTCKLPDDYQVELVTLEDGVHKSAKEAYEPLCEMLKAGRKEGLLFEICSAYRSVERQQELFDEDMEVLLRAGYSYSRAYEEVAKETMPPGYSEHSTGLAFDIVAYDYQMLDAGQEETAENQWLQAHCAEYGFILRYPKGKESITQINYESWHFRYVGVEAAKYITENQLTLEEYLEL